MLDSSSPFLPTPALSRTGPSASVTEALLRRAIVAAELEPGTFVDEKSLAQRYGLGRTAVRAALAALAPALVDRRPRQGWRIAPVDGPLLRSVFDARRRLEPSLVGPRPGGLDLAEITRSADLAVAAGRAAEDGARATARAADRGVRDGLAAAAGPLAQRWFTDLWDHADRIVCALRRHGVSIAVADWRPLIEALARGDAADAERLLAAEHDRWERAVTDGFLAVEVSLARSHGRSARRRARQSPTLDTSSSRASAGDASDRTGVKQ